MTEIFLSFLGEQTITVDGRRVALPTHKTEALLAYLVLESDQSHGRSTLAGLLWPDYSQQRARINLRNTLHRLRSALDEAAPDVSDHLLSVSRQSIRFIPTQTRVDVLEFQARISSVAEHDHESIAGCAHCRAQLIKAVELYSGELLRGLSLPDAFPFEEWLLLRREYLHHVAIRAFSNLAASMETDGQLGQAQAVTMRLLELDPYREGTHRQLMRLLARQGMAKQSLAHYDVLRQLLRRELSVEPDEETTELVRQISSGVYKQPSGGTVSPPATSLKLHIHWSEAPLIGTFWGRTDEMRLLERWMIQDHTQLIALLGSGGVGKSTLAAQVTRTLAGKYDVILWFSLLNALPFDELMARFLERLTEPSLAALTESLDGKLSQLLEGLRQYRCLLVLDNMETIMQHKEAGRFLPEYQGYEQLFQLLGAYEHRSCLLFTSRERPLSISRLERNSNRVRSFQLTGLDIQAGQSLLREHGLEVSGQHAAALIQHYSGNPLALSLVAEVIEDLFQGDVASFLGEEFPIFDDIRDVLDQQFDRLSQIEYNVLTWLAIARKPLGLSDLQAYVLEAVRPHELIQTLNSLERRSLLERSGQGFTLQNVITEYLTDCLVTEVRREIEGGYVDFLDRFALLHAQAEDYNRHSQARVILNPILNQLAAVMNRDEAAAMIHKLIAVLRDRGVPKPGYAAGNLLNLLLHMQVDVTAYDFSYLSVWEAHLQGKYLPRVNFAGADLSRCSFTDTFNVITSVAFSPDGRFMAAACAEGEVRLWRTSDGMLVAILDGNGYVVLSIAFSPDGRTLASGSLDSTVRLWDVPQSPTERFGQTRAVLQGHHGSVMSVCFSPDGKTLASCSRDRSVRLWDLGEVLVTPAASASHVLEGHTDTVLSTAFSPDGRTLASSSADGTIRLWNLTNAGTLASGPAIQKILHGHEAPVNSILYSPNGDTLVSGSNDSTLRVWDAASGRCRHVLKGHTDWVNGIAYDPTGRFLASAGVDRTIRIWDLTDRQVLTNERPPHILRVHTDWVRDVAFSPDGRNLASAGDDKTVRLWDVQTRRLLRTHQGFKNRVLSIDFSPDGLRLASGSEDGAVRLWQIDDLQARSAPKHMVLRVRSGRIMVVAFHPHGRFLVSGGEDIPLTIWHGETGALLYELPGDGHWVACAVFSPDGRFLATGGDDTMVHLWKVAEDMSLQSQRPSLLQGHEQTILGLAFSRDGSLLASSSADNTIRLWDMNSGDLLHTLMGHTKWVNSIAFSPDGTMLASASADNTISLWDMDGKRCQILQGHTAWVRSVAFSPDGQTLASCGNDFTIRLWDLASGKTRQVLKDHEDIVWTVTFTNDGTVMASASGDETIKLWDPHTGKCTMSWRMPGPYEDMDIRGVTGITEAQRLALLGLGAVSHT